MITGVSPTAIAVQSPYIAQVQLLREKLEQYPELSAVEVSTIDSFQGREADAVIISMVSTVACLVSFWFLHHTSMNEIHSGCDDPITNHFVFHFKPLYTAMCFYWLMHIFVPIIGSLKSTGSRRVSGRQQAHQRGYYKGTQAHHCGLWYLHYLSQHLPGQAPSPCQAIWSSKTCCSWHLGWGFWPRLQSTYSPLYRLTVWEIYKHSVWACTHASSWRLCTYTRHWKQRNHMAGRPVLVISMKRMQTVIHG